MFDPELVEAAAWFAVTFAICETLAIISGVALAWLVADSLRK